MLKPSTRHTSRRNTCESSSRYKRAGGCHSRQAAFQHRLPTLINLVSSRVIDGVCASHALATLYYIVRKHSGLLGAEKVIDDVLNDFEIGSLDKAGWRKARQLTFPDFEDAAVAVVAQETGCQYIVTRDVSDFNFSPVPAISPSGFLKL